MKTEIKLKSIERRFQMLLGIFLFFPTLISALGGNTEVQSQTIINWSFVIVFLILAYVLLEITGEKIGKGLLKVLNVLILINTTLFSIILFLFARYKETLPITAEYVFRIALLSIMGIPVIIFIILGVKAFILLNDWIVSFVPARKERKK